MSRVVGVVGVGWASGSTPTPNSLFTGIYRLMGFRWLIVGHKFRVFDMFFQLPLPTAP